MGPKSLIARFWEDNDKIQKKTETHLDAVTRGFVLRVCD